MLATLYILLCKMLRDNLFLQVHFALTKEVSHFAKGGFTFCIANIYLPLTKEVSVR